MSELGFESRSVCPQGCPHCVGMSPEAAWARLDMAVPQYECRSGCGSAWLIHPGTGPRRHTSINRSDTWALWRWVCHARMCAPPCSRVWLFETPWTVAHQDPLSMEFSRQEHRSRLPFPTPGDLSDPGIKLTSPMSPDRLILYHWATWEAQILHRRKQFEIMRVSVENPYL